MLPASEIPGRIPQSALDTYMFMLQRRDVPSYSAEICSHLFADVCPVT